MGLDAVIGLLPVAGDLLSGLISSYLIWEARQIGAPRWLIARMMANTLLDTTFGAVPVLGDAFDVLFRGNMTQHGPAAQAHGRRAAGRLRPCHRGRGYPR